VGPTEPVVVAWLTSLGSVVDLANGAPDTTALRGTIVAAAVARELALDERAAAAAVIGSLFRYLGCTSYAHEDADLFGDEHEAARLLAAFEPTEGLAIARAVATELEPESSLLARARRLARLALEGRAFRRGYEASQCEGATLLASRLDVTRDVRETLDALYERWDGSGGPAGAAGERISVAARVLHVAREATVHYLLRGGLAGVVRCLEQRRGGQLDPAICRAMLGSEALAAAFSDEALFERASAVIRAHLAHAFTKLPSLDTIAEVFGDFADQKCPWFLGHARRVAGLARAAAEHLALEPATIETLVRAAWLHDVGRVSVPNRIWATRGPLGTLEWERVRLHAYVAERVCQALDPEIAHLVGAHHEREDGSGYARGIRPNLVASVLAAADVCAALGADRPHRERWTEAKRDELLQAEVAKGRLRADAVEAVLVALGRAPSSRPPSLLSQREREVLRLAARGASNKEIAASLGISSRTVQSHTIRIYDKLGVRTRAGAALRGAELGLLGPLHE